MQIVRTVQGSNRLPRFAAAMAESEDSAESAAATATPPPARASASAGEKRCDKCKRDDEVSYILINKSLVENKNRTPIWRCTACNNTGNIIWNL